MFGQETESIAMNQRTRRSLGLVAYLFCILLIAGRFYLRHIGKPDTADLCTIMAFIMMGISGWLRHSARTPV